MSAVDLDKLRADVEARAKASGAAMLDAAGSQQLDLVLEQAARALGGDERAEAHLKAAPDDARALYMGANGLVAMGEVEKGLEWAAVRLLGRAAGHHDEREDRLTALYRRVMGRLIGVPRARWMFLGIVALLALRAAWALQA